MMKLFERIIQIYARIEELRQSLCTQKDFDAYIGFKLLDLTKNNAISANNL